MYQLVIFKKDSQRAMEARRKDALAHNHCQHEQQKEWKVLANKYAKNFSSLFVNMIHKHDP